MIRYISLAVLFTLAAFGQGVIDGLCSVTLRVVDFGGLSVTHRVVSFVDTDGSDYVGSFVGLQGKVPCKASPYTLTVTRTDVSSRYANIRQKISVSFPETWLTLVTDPNLRFGSFGAGFLSRSVPVGHVWNGTISPMSSDRLWIFVRSAVDSSETVESEVDIDGRFRIYGGLIEGPYVIHIVNQDGKIVHLGALSIEKFAPKEPLAISLGGLPRATVVK